MPPSGFSQKAVNGLLLFLEACYEDLLNEMQNSKEPEDIVRKELDDIRNYVKNFTIKH